MSNQLINRSSDLTRLQQEGYDLKIDSGHLVVSSIPYVNAKKEIKYGSLISTLDLAGDKTTTPRTHVVYFDGEHPCNQHGAILEAIHHASPNKRLSSNLLGQHSFSSKPKGGYKDYYDKMTSYIRIIISHVVALDSTITATPFNVIANDESKSSFCYTDTASSRAEIGDVTSKLAKQKVAIIGLGGTGSYVLDLIAKTPVGEIAIYDGDKFLQHNAFRAPGAPSIDELKAMPYKVEHHSRTYSKMKRNITAHPVHIDEANIEQLREMDFVFICLDKGSVKKLLFEKLEEWRISFIDTGIGVEVIDGSIAGSVRTTTSTTEHRDHVANYISFADAGHDEVYSHNIQIADLNALNAVLAVIKWKKICGFYTDLEKEYNSVYTINGNHLASRGTHEA